MNVYPQRGIICPDNDYLLQYFNRYTVFFSYCQLQLKKSGFSLARRAWSIVAMI
jgi:hypothetical protein